MKGIVRGIFTMSLIMVATVEAGWFGGSEEPKRGRDRGAPRGRRDDGPDDYDPQEDYQMEDDYEEEAQKKKKFPAFAGVRDTVSRIAEMKKKHSKSRDEMISDEYNVEMFADEIIEETFTPEQNEDGYLTDDDINRIWSDHMHDFVPEDMMNAIVEHKSTEALFEYIGHTEPT